MIRVALLLLGFAAGAFVQQCGFEYRAKIEAGRQASMVYHEGKGPLLCR